MKKYIILSNNILLIISRNVYLIFIKILTVMANNILNYKFFNLIDSN